MDKVIEYLREHQAEHVEWVRDWCRIPSVSTKPEHKDDMATAASWLAERMNQVGLRAEVHQTAGHPLVYAEHCEAAGAPTVLVYGHFDVQPEGDLSLWDADPFDPVVKDGKIFSRGAADNKGQVLVHVRAVAAWLATEKKLPVNLKFLVEGEEEISSPSLMPFLKEHIDLFKCDQILISDTGMFAEGWPTITCGTRGILFKELRLSGPMHDLHSGSFGGSVANPANVLAAIIASLHDAEGRVTIPGFYDDVVEATPAEREAMRALPFDEQQYIADTGVPGLTGEAGFTTNERRWIRPTLDVNGLFGGFSGKGANTIIPKSAGAKVSMRLVPNQDGAKLSRQFDEAIRARCPDTVRLEIMEHGSAEAYVAPVEGRPMQAARRALQEAFGREPALIREGGSLPILAAFKRILKADSLMLGFADPNCNAHGPNEFIRIDDLNRGAEAIARVLGYLAE